jgi:hypothetical protein
VKPTFLKPSPREHYLHRTLSLKYLKIGEATMKSLYANLKLNLPGRVMIIALLGEIALVIVYWFDVATAGHHQTIHALFDLDSEGNIPAWFSSSQLLCVAITFWTCTLRKPRFGRPSRLFFALAGLAAVYASSDETAQIHERITALMGQRYIDWLPDYAAHNFLLVMAAVALLLTVCQLLADDLLLLWNNYRRPTLLAMVGIAIALTGGMGVETLGYKIFHGSSGSVWYKLGVTVEEFMEMLGATLVLVSALNLRLRKASGVALEPTRDMKLQLARQRALSF